MSKLKIKNLDTNEFEELPLIQGEKGERGYSAYEIAVQNGYKGTEAEWTKAFLSPDGYYGKTEIDNKENNLKAENEYLNSVIEQAFTPVEKEGTSINYDNTINARFKDIKLCGDTTQNGTPTPDTPIPVNVVSGDNEINVCGKNLLNLTSDKVVYNYAINYTLEPNKFVGVPTADWARIKAKFSVEPNTDYTFSSDMGIEGASPSTFQFTIETVDAESIYNGNVTLVNGKLIKTFNTGNNSGILISFWGKLGNAGGNITKVTYNNIQLEKGSQASTFESYQSNIYNIDLPEGIELCKIGNYQDYIHKDNGKWYKYGAIGKIVLDGSENWNITNRDAGGKYFWKMYKDLTIPIGIYGYKLCDNFSYQEVDYTSATPNHLAENDRKNLSILFCVDFASTVNEWKTWLSTHNTIVYYVLATPTTTEITDTTLLEQLEELAGAKTYAGETNIVATSDGLTIIPKTTALTK